MPKKGQFKSRPGFERIPGAKRLYRDLSTNEIISKRQYVKRTEKVKSLEDKAKRLAVERFQQGKRKPMKRYNAIVEQYKKVYGSDAKVRGNTSEAQQFKDHYKIFTKHTKTKKERQEHLDAGVELGIITDQQRENYKYE